MSGALLSFERVSYSYPEAERPALSDVSLELHPGEFCLLAGLSGSGKSSLLGAACGRLVLSGILDSQIEMVQARLLELAVVDFEIDQDGEWIAVVI